MTEGFRIDPAELPSEAVIFGSTAAMQAVRTQIAPMLNGTSPLLIQGEGGTGKEMIARYLHSHSGRCAGPFVKLACTAMPAEWLERELLGYRRGAFRGARNSKKGLVEAADGGTLFLAGVDGMDWTLQGKLFRLLRDGSYFRIGGFEERRADVRVICSSEADLREAVKAGRFRRDLFLCISRLCLRLPALRDRKEDIPQLWGYFARKFAAKFNRSLPTLTPAALRILEGWSWPGNLHELENGVARAIILSDENALGAELKHKMAWNSMEDMLPAESGNVVISHPAELAEPESALERVIHANQWDTHWDPKNVVQTNSRPQPRTKRERNSSRRCRTSWHRPTEQ